MKKIYRFPLLLILICLAHGVPLNPLMGGGPPLVTDDTGTPGHNGWEINLAYTITHTTQEKASEYTLDVNYGVGEKTQLNVVIPYVTTQHDEDGVDDGMGDVQFATKYRFFDEKGWLPSISATPTVFMPTGSGRSRPDFFLPLEFDRNIRSLYIGSQIGYAIHQEKGENDELFYGLFCEYPAFEKIDVMGEVFGFLTKDTEVNSPHFNGGLRYKFSELFSIMCSAGKSFEGRGSGEPHLLGYAGIRFNF